MVQIYRKKWRRGIIGSLFGYIRDCIILVLPVRRLPRPLVKFLYGVNPKFAFFVHPRAYQDVFISTPFLRPLKLVLRKKIGYRLSAAMAPFVLNTVRTKQGVDGVVIAQLTVPELLFEQRQKSIKMLITALRLVSKISCSTAVVGLGGWFPMLTRRGASLEEHGKKLGLSVTNGHCGTLASIYMTVERISKVGGLNLSELTLAIIGVGKMGTNVAKAFNGKVKKIFLIDVIQNNLKKTEEDLRKNKSDTEIEIVLSDTKDPNCLRNALKESHVGICATSTFRNGGGAFKSGWCYYRL